MSVKECRKCHHHANGSSVALSVTLNHWLEPCWKLLSHIWFCLTFFQQKRHRIKVGFFCVSLISFGLYTDSLNFFLGCSCLHWCLSFQHWTSSGQDVTIHWCSFRNDLWVGLGFFSPFPANYMARKPIALERFFLLAQTVVSHVCHLKGDQRWRYWVCCLGLKMGIEILLQRDRCSYVEIAVRLAGEAFYSLWQKKRMPIFGWSYLVFSLPLLFWLTGHKTHKLCIHFAVETEWSWMFNCYAQASYHSSFFLWRCILT